MIFTVKNIIKNIYISNWMMEPEIEKHPTRRKCFKLGGEGAKGKKIKKNLKLNSKIFKEKKKYIKIDGKIFEENKM